MSCDFIQVMVGNRNVHALSQEFGGWMTWHIISWMWILYIYVFPFAHKDVYINVYIFGPAFPGTSHLRTCLKTTSNIHLFPANTKPLFSDAAERLPLMDNMAYQSEWSLKALLLDVISCGILSIKSYISYQLVIHYVYASLYDNEMFIHINWLSNFLYQEHHWYAGST